VDIALRRASDAARALPPAARLATVVAEPDVEAAGFELPDAAPVLTALFIAALPPLDKALRRSSANALLLFAFAVATCDMIHPTFYRCSLKDQYR
jgi:hypothetical protein